MAQSAVRGFREAVGGRGASRYLRRPQGRTQEEAYPFYPDRVAKAMQVGLELAPGQESATSSLHTHLSGYMWLFRTALLQLLLLYEVARFIRIPALCRHSEEHGRAHSMTCPESWPPLGRESASSPHPQPLGDATHLYMGCSFPLTPQFLMSAHIAPLPSPFHQVQA